MALGCPALAARSGAVRDMIQDGENGVIVDPSPEALAEGICRLLGSQEMRAQLAGQGRRRAEEFSAGNMAARLSRVYASLLKQ